MQTSPNNDFLANVPDGLAQQHLNNLLYVNNVRNAAPEEVRSTGAMRLSSGSPGETKEGEPAVRLQGSPTSKEEHEPFALFAGMLRFLAANPAHDEAKREWQTIGSIELLRCLNAEPDWIDLVCMARQRHKYTVLPVLLEETSPDEPDETEESHRLVLHRTDSVQVNATELREAFARAQGVLGAFTEVGFGVFVSLVFDL